MMVDEKELEQRPASPAGEEEDLSKAELQRRLEETRESISLTVHEIKDTVTDQYEAVKETVGGVLDYREQFQKDPLVWSVGALSAGFALGYTLGYAHKHTKSEKHSEIAAFADSLIDEISAVGRTFVMPTLNSKIKDLFGFDFSDLLEEIGQTRKSGKSKSAASKGSKKSRSKPATKKTSAKKRSSKKSRAS